MEPTPGTVRKTAPQPTNTPPQDNTVSQASHLGAQQAPEKAQPPTPAPAPRELPQPAPQTGQPAPLPAPRELPADEAPTKLTLDQVINAVILNDPKLRAGFEAINQANADALTASLRPNPSWFNDGQLLPLTRPFTVTDQGGPPQQDSQLTYPIDWYLFGKRAANMVVAARGVKATEADFEDQVRIRVTEAATGYYDVLEAEGLLSLARQDLENLERVEAATAKAVAAGGKTQVELNRLRLDLAQARRLVREAETLLVAAKSRLRALLGRPDRDPAFEVVGTIDAPLDAVLPTPEEAFEQAIKNRPDLRSLQWKVAQARASVDAETRKAYPEVSPMIGYTRQYQRKAIGFPDANSWTIAGTITLPLFDRNQGNRAKAVSVVAQNQLQYQAAVVAVRAEVETASQEFRSARATATDIAGDQLKLAREVRDSIAAAYQAGGRPLVDLLDAERNFRDTYRSYVSSRAAYWRAVFKYRSAIGPQTPP
jgi:cobalt-zinc-cadmium efflux system outer membrane protein